MTCVVAITDGTTVWMGADSAGTNDVGEVFIKANPKVWRAGECVLGTCGDARMSQALQYYFEPPPVQGDDVFRHMIGIFVEKLREALRQGGALLRKTEVDEIDGHILVGLRGHIFTVGSHFGITETIEPYGAIGTGAPEARGALWGIRAHNSPVAEFDTDKLLLAALTASERFNSGVQRPFTIVSTRAEE